MVFPFSAGMFSDLWAIKLLLGNEKTSPYKSEKPGEELSVFLPVIVKLFDNSEAGRMYCLLIINKLRVWHGNGSYFAVMKGL